MFESVDARTDGRRLDSHPISSPCEPSAHLGANKNCVQKCNSSPSPSVSDSANSVII